MKFTHLHLHTQYSLLDGAIRLPELFKKCKEFGQDSVAITDHGSFFGGMHFWDLAKKNDIKPILGSEVYITPGSRFDRSKTPGDPEGKINHLILLIQNRKGYENLSKLLTIGFHEGFYYKPRIDHDVLEKNNEGLICLSACIAGEVPRNIINNKIEQAWDIAKWYKKVFGDRYYLELQENSIPEQKTANREIIKIARDLHIPLVATNDCHYLQKKDVRAHEILLCIQTNTTINNIKRFKLSSDDFYFRSTEEMTELFKDLPEAIENTQVIVERCDFSFPRKKYHLPQIEPPKGKNLDDHLREESVKGLEERWSDINELHVSKNTGDIGQIKNIYMTRLEHELKVIIDMKFSGYFLIVADFIRWAKNNNIPVGPGRGSGAGSLVAYALRITDVDPIPYNLIFERFLNPERISMPDFDIDFCQDRREEVIDYVEQKYGTENVGMIITYGSLKARGVIRDVARAFEVPYSEADQIAKLVPETLNITLKEALEQEPKLKELMKKDPVIADVITTALSLEGLFKSVGTHAAGIIISNKPLVEHLPIFRGKQGERVTMFDMKCIEELGLIKFDFLGLKTLSIIKQAENIIKRLKPEFDISKINLSDSETYELYQQGNTLGVFQVESSGMREILTKIKPTTFEDLIAINALHRPGPLGSGMLDSYINRRHGKEKVKYPFPELEDILKETYGIIVYQEQVMQIATKMSNYTIGEADLLRSAMGKKKSDVMRKQKSKFIEGCKNNGHDLEKAAELFELMEKFAEYGFNKSHSTAYMIVSFQTAYLKKKYPHAFFASLLSYEMDNTDKITQYIADAKENGIEILPPDINESEQLFSIVERDEKKAIRFGLGAVKNVGEAAIDVIITERDKSGKFSDLQELVTRIDTSKANKRIFENLIKAGALDFDGHNRQTLLTNLESIIQFVQSIKDDRAVGQVTIFDILGTEEENEEFKYNWTITPEWDEKMTLQFEKEALGFYASGHPLEKYISLVNEYASYKSSDILNTGFEKREVIVGGIISLIKEIRTKAGKKMAFLTLEDLEGATEIVVFPEPYEAYKEIIKSDEPLFITGTLESNENGVKILVSTPKFDTQNNQNNYKKLFEQMKDVKLKQKQTFYLNVNLNQTVEDKIRNLKYIINSHKGTTPIILNININDRATTTIKLPDYYKINPTPTFINKVENLFNKDSINLV